MIHNFRQLCANKLDLEIGMLGDVVYKYVRPETLRALHFYMGVGGADRFLSSIPEEQWDKADELAVKHVRQFCKCCGGGCMACRLTYSVNGEQGEAMETGK